MVSEASFFMYNILFWVGLIKANGRRQAEVREEDSYTAVMISDQGVRERTDADVEGSSNIQGKASPSVSVQS